MAVLSISSSSETFSPHTYALSLLAALILRLVVVLVAATRLTITSTDVSGRPRQFIEITENIRCSILFQLLVPGGKWQTQMD